jgi:uncharacterized protein
MIWSNIASAVRTAAFALAAGFVLAGAAHADPKLPELTGRVVDDANILPAETRLALTQKLAAVEQANGDQIVVVTVPDLQGYDIADFGNQLGRKWGIGQKGKDNGVVFLIAPKDHKATIEVGYKLEPVLTDTESFVILNHDVFPRFKAGDYAGGVTAGVDDIIKQVSDPADQAAARAQAATSEVRIRPPHRHANPIGGLVVLVIVIVVFSSLFRRGGGGGGGLLPLIFLGSMMGGRGRDDDWGGGGGDGGGFSGGGGSFGGGGSSGSW